MLRCIFVFVFIDVAMDLLKGLIVIRAQGRRRRRRSSLIIAKNDLKRHAGQTLGDFQESLDSFSFMESEKYNCNSNLSNLLIHPSFYGCASANRGALRPRATSGELVTVRQLASLESPSPAQIWHSDRMQRQPCHAGLYKRSARPPK